MAAQRRSRMSVIGRRILAALENPVETDIASPDQWQVWWSLPEARLKTHVDGVTKPFRLFEAIEAGEGGAGLLDAITGTLTGEDGTMSPRTVLLRQLAGLKARSVTVAHARALLGIEKGEEINKAQAIRAISALRGAIPDRFDRLIELLDELQGGEDAAYTRKFAETIGGGLSRIYTVTHGLGTLDVTLSAFPIDSNTPLPDYDWRPTSEEVVGIRFPLPLPDASVRVVVVG